MDTDKTAFDDFLKQKLHRDILFRIMVWASISGLTAYFASYDTSFTTLAHLQKVADSLMPVVNVIGVIAILMSGVALVLKDLEHVAPVTWGQSTVAGKIGGFVRRLAGDLSLWVLGALVTLLSAVTLVALGAYQANAMTAHNVAAIFTMYLVFLALLVVMAILNVLVRRAKAPLAASRPFTDFLTSPTRVIACYCFVLAFTIFLI